MIGCTAENAGLAAAAAAADEVSRIVEGDAFVIRHLRACNVDGLD